MNPDKQSGGLPLPPSGLPPPYVTHGPPPPPSGVTVVYPGSTATIIVSPQLGAHPTQRTCPSCGAVIVTRVEKKATTKTHLIALLLCFTCLWPCACCVYCMDSCMSTNHSCPNCNAYIGTHKN